MGGFAGLCLGLLYSLQNKLIYVPVLPGLPRDYVVFPPTYGLDYEDIWITAADGVALNAWLMWPQHWAPARLYERPVLVFFQENAGNMSFRLPFLKALSRALDCSTFILGYRGYGRSQGRPSEQGIMLDAKAAMEHLLSRSDIDPSKIVLMGRSLGGAVAIYAATQYRDKIRGLIVENTFTSLEDVAPHTMPFLSPLLGPGRPCNWLLRNKWYSDRRVKELKSLPILFLSSLSDEMLHPGQMEALYLTHGRAPWHFEPFQGARHMDCYETHGDQYWPIVEEFVDRLFHEKLNGDARESKLTHLTHGRTLRHM